MAIDKERKDLFISERIEKRVNLLETVWVRELKAPGRLLLIRPRVPGDDYTVFGSNVWAGEVKTKALDEGWTVVDLNSNDATRENIEDAISTERPDLIMHYDHGGAMTLWGQEDDALEPGLDDLNINLASGRIVSTVSCLSASGLGPAGIAAGVTAYLGYTDLHSFWTGGYEGRFGEASNAANFALLECKSMQEAFDAGWAAYDQLYVDLLAEGGFSATTVAPTALHDRDCFTLLGSTGAVACPQASFFQCRPGLPNSPYVCLKGGPNTPILCRFGQPNSIGPMCKAMPDVAACGKGPDMGCAAGPMLDIREILEVYPDDLVVVNMDKLPQDMKKSFNLLLSKIRNER